MTTPFIYDDFLLQNAIARNLYHNTARQLPIYDYHCHLPARAIAEDTTFATITQAWLNGDHYKWRAMRTHGIDEHNITGKASDEEKFRCWAQTVPFTLGNPLYHWTHLELKRYFGIDSLLNPDSAQTIYKQTADQLNSPEYTTRHLIRKMNVRLICTTEDPLDSLQYHQQLRNEDLPFVVHTAWRPDRAMNPQDPAALNQWIDRLQELTNIDIHSFDTYLQAIRQRHDVFHDNGCRLSDHGLDTVPAEPATATEINTIFDKLRHQKTNLTPHQADQFASAMLHELALMNAEKNWVQQLHIGAMRNNNTRMLNSLGPDTGYDSIGDLPVAQPLSRFLDRLDATNQLAKTILYNLNPRDNELYATMIGNFQQGPTPAKLQYGSGWWFLDQKDGMERQLTALANLSLLPHFVGMLTDSRSFLSFPRHEYFRRVLCNFLGNLVQTGQLPNDDSLLHQTVANICYHNATHYFPMTL